MKSVHKFVCGKKKKAADTFAIYYYLLLYGCVIKQKTGEQKKLCTIICDHKHIMHN